MGLRAVRRRRPPASSRRSPSTSTSRRPARRSPALCGDRDADAYRAFVKDWGARNEAVFEAFQDVPTAGRLGRHLWGAGKAASVGGLEMSRQFLQPADQLLDEHFTDERLKTALSWLGAQSGPPTHEVATADLVGWNALMHKLPPGRAVGGSGALTQALAERLRRLGGTVRLGDGAASITRSGDRVTGVTTESGDRINARTVVAGCHVLTTLELLADEALLRRATTAVRVGNGIGMVVRLATIGTPPLPVGSRRQLRCDVRLDAAPRTEPHLPPQRARRLRRGPHADRAGRPRHDARPPSTRRSRRPASTSSPRGRSGIPTSCRPASTGTTSATARATGSSRRSSARRRASPTRSSRCTCRRRSTWSASSACAAAT